MGTACALRRCRLRRETAALQRAAWQAVAAGQVAAAAAAAGCGVAAGGGRLRRCSGRHGRLWRRLRRRVRRQRRRRRQAAALQRAAAGCGVAAGGGGRHMVLHEIRSKRSHHCRRGGVAAAAWQAVGVAAAGVVRAAVAMVVAGQAAGVAIEARERVGAARRLAGSPAGLQAGRLHDGLVWKAWNALVLSRGWAGTHWVSGRWGRWGCGRARGGAGWLVGWLPVSVAGWPAGRPAS